MIAGFKPDAVRIDYDDVVADGVLQKVNFGTVKRIALIGNAARAFHVASNKAQQSALVQNDNPTISEVIILDRKPKT